MNDAVGLELRNIIDRYGPEVCEDPRRVEALLRDLSGEHRREIFVLAGGQPGREFRLSCARAAVRCLFRY